MTLLRQCGTSKLLRQCGTGKLLRACEARLLCDVTGTLSFVFSGPLTLDTDLCRGGVAGAPAFKITEVPTGFVIPANVPKATSVDVSVIGKLVADYYGHNNCSCDGVPIVGQEAASGFQFAWDIRGWPDFGWGDTFCAWIWLPDWGGGNFGFGAQPMILHYIEVPCSFSPREGTYGNYTFDHSCGFVVGGARPTDYGNYIHATTGGSMTVSVP
jgi:hypothetical protein